MTTPEPLRGVRVLDLSQNLAGPYCTQILADLGADVIKVEPPGGDPARAWGPPFMGDDSPLFLCGNRNKRSIVLDLQREDGRTTLRRLIRHTDVLVQAFRSGVAERLGFDYPTVRGLRPDVLYVSVTAFGTDGPLRDQPGYDPLMQAYAGLMSVTGTAAGDRVRVGTSVVDMGTGMWAAMATLAELHERELKRRRGSKPEARHLTVSLLDTALGWMAYHLQGHLGSGDVPRPLGTGLGMIAPYQAFPAADGQVMIAAGNDATFRRLCDALDLATLAADPRYGTNPERVAHRDELVAEVARQTRSRTVVDLLETLRHAAVPCAPIQDVGEVVEDPQVEVSGMLRRTRDSSTAGDYVDVAPPYRWDGERPPLKATPPAPGQHTHQVLAELDRLEEEAPERGSAGSGPTEGRDW